MFVVWLFVEGSRWSGGLLCERDGRANGACGLPRASSAAGSGWLCGAIATLCLEWGLVLSAPAFLIGNSNE